MELDCRLKWRVGLRTAMFLTHVASKYRSTIEVSCRGLTVSAKDNMSLCLALLDAPSDTPVRLSINGPDAPEAMAALKDLFTQGERLKKCLYQGCPSPPILVDLWADHTHYGCSNGHEWNVPRKRLGWPEKTAPEDRWGGVSKPWRGPIPKQGECPWPGRERLHPRDRALLETKTMLNLFLLITDEYDPTYGFIDYLTRDWMLLHKEQLAPWGHRYFSFHKSSLRDDWDYARKIKYKGQIPRSDKVFDWLDAFLS